jgi:anthranilate phosphoribosyltransferase
MKDILNHLYNYQTLDRDIAKTILTNIAEARYNPAQVAAFLTVFNMRPLTPDELSGFREAMLEMSIHIDLSGFETMDVCGTGGDGKNTFNISTLSAFVLAGAGVKVAKHGNNGVSSACGSSNLMAHFGYHFTNSQSQLAAEMESAGICFLHAPLFHPAMKNIGPIRKELAVKTFFNVLGPLINPANPQNQFAGVFNLETARLYAYTLRQTTRNFGVVHSIDGYDEISLTGRFKVITRDSERLYTPEDLDFRTLPPKDIWGGDTIQNSADIFMAVMKNEASPAQKAVVLANSAFALACAGQNDDLMACRAKAEESLESGRALKAFSKLVETNKTYAS